MGDASRLLVALAVIILTAPAAHADAPEFEAGVFIGGDLLGGNNELGNAAFDDQVPQSTVLFGLRFGIRFMQHFGAEIEGKAAPTETEGGMGRPSIATTVLGYRVHGMYLHDFTPKLDAFGIVGVGLETAVFDDPPSQLRINTPDTDGAFYWGIGATYAISDRLGARLDFRQLLTAGRDSSIALVHEAHLGVAFKFGTGKSETVIVERIVEKPVETPTKPAVVDSDGDGFPDETDKCPQAAEIFNGIDDEDGCPEIDSDNDGLLGTRDQCPDAAEDADGFEDDDGCPDYDNDNDGRPDRIDACPMEAETLNGYKDDDGCPDELPQKVAEFTGIIKGIRFKKGSARILRASNKTLNKAVKVFKEYSDLRIEISGHTDNKGGAKTNVQLSRKRADYVKWYLVDNGIGPERIITVGYGPEKPIANNKTRKGRSQNRRIEFRLQLGPRQIGLGGDNTPVKPD